MVFCIKHMSDDVLLHHRDHFLLSIMGMFSALLGSTYFAIPLKYFKHQRLMSLNVLASIQSGDVEI